MLSMLATSKIDLAVFYLASSLFRSSYISRALPAGSTFNVEHALKIQAYSGVSHA